MAVGTCSGALFKLKQELLEDEGIEQHAKAAAQLYEGHKPKAPPMCLIQGLSDVPLDAKVHKLERRLGKSMKSVSLIVM